MLASYKFNKYKTGDENKENNLKELYIINADNSIADDMHEGIKLWCPCKGTIMRVDLSTNRAI